MSASVISEQSSSFRLSKKEGEKIGVTLENKLDGGVAIAKIVPKSIAAKADLKEGQRIKSINGRDVSGLKSNSVARTLRMASGPIDIVVEDEQTEAATDSEHALEQAPVAADEEQISDEDKEENGVDSFNCWGCTVQ